MSRWQRGPSPARARAARRTIDALSADRDVWAHFFETVPIGLALADLSTRYLRLNGTYAALLGQAAEDVVGVPFPDVLGLPAPRAPEPSMADAETADAETADAEATDAEAAYPGTDGAAVDGGQADLLGELLTGSRSSLETEQRYVTPSGSELWLLHGVSWVADTDGEAGWFALSAQDITERRRVEQELRELTTVLAERAVRDPLTGVANRTLIEERLRASLSRDGRTGGTTGLLFLDLDSFKAVNDRYGHAVGDQVLRVVAERLTSGVRPSDTVGRLGGDEFVVLAENTTRAGLDALVARLETLVEQPLQLAKLNLDVGVSIGVAVSEAGAADATSLLVAADSAMYVAKRTPRSQVTGDTPEPG